ncbi:MAG TPA: UbiD family decarboxylase, partial [Polyangia bacterium]
MTTGIVMTTASGASGPNESGPIGGVPAHWDSLGAFVRFLEERGELRRITREIDPVLEVSAIAQRAVRENGPALLFERIKGSRYPLLINTYATRRRISWALGVPDLDEHARAIHDLVKSQPPVGLMDKVRMLPKLARVASAMPKTVRHAACQEVVESEPDLSRLPILTTWPEDGGPYITLPMVITRDPENGTRNVGCYRMQVYDQRTTAMHWQLHKTGRRHMRRYKEMGHQRMPVAVALGGDPVLAYAATAPLPDGIDELMFAGFLRRKPVEMVQCKTVDLEVPASADFILEGTVDVDELRREGPFGDHTGYYSLADDYPVFHLTCITRRDSPIYATTVVGPPPQEDAWLGKATERLFLPL